MWAQPVLELERRPRAYGQNSVTGESTTMLFFFVEAHVNGV